MLEPKTFYRKLDILLNKIGRERTGKDFLFVIADELEKTFGEDLRIGNGRIYELCDDSYELITPQDSLPDNGYAEKLHVESGAVQALLRYKSYIYNDPSFSIDKRINGQKEYRIPVAFSLNSPEYKWIFVFELKSGWIREEIEFCLNAVRTALNYRVLSDSVKNEMQQAVQIQQSLLPQINPQIEGYQIASHSMPAELVGGDFYDYFAISDRSFGIALGDASGHGLPAALLVRDMVTGLRMGLESSLPPVKNIRNANRIFSRRFYSFHMEDMLKKLNRVIYKSVYSSRFVSMFIAEIDRRGNIHYANAGHPSPLLVSGQNVRLLESTGYIFGALPEMVIKGTYASMKKDDVLVIFSDGIVERQNPTGEEFGMERLKELIVKHRDKSAQVLLELIFFAADDFGKVEKWEDDASVMVIKKI